MTAMFLLALALAQAPVPESLGLQITTVTRVSNGPDKLGGMFFIPHPIGRSNAIYYFANPTVCDGLASSAAPTTGSPGVRVAGPKFGWRVEVTSPPGTAPVLKWSRLDGAAKAVAPLDGTKTLPRELPVFKNIELDSLDQKLPGGAECGAVSYSLVARYAPAFRHRAAQSKVLEAELWFVHKAPDGKEETQRQVVRMRDGGRGDFYFDDLNLTAQNESLTLPVAVEVFGTINTGTMMSNGDINIALSLTRRYINKAAAIGRWPKTGSTDYPMTVRAGEVVSFVLPPLADDGGILLGHRFSLRLRLKPLAPGQN